MPTCTDTDSWRIDAVESTPCPNTREVARALAPHAPHVPAGAVHLVARALARRGFSPDDAAFHASAHHRAPLERALGALPTSADIQATGALLAARAPFARLEVLAHTRAGAFAATALRRALAKAPRPDDAPVTRLVLEGETTRARDACVVRILGSGDAILACEGAGEDLATLVARVLDAAGAHPPATARTLALARAADAAGARTAPARRLAFILQARCIRDDEHPLHRHAATTALLEAAGVDPRPPEAVEVVLDHGHASVPDLATVQSLLLPWSTLHPPLHVAARTGTLEQTGDARWWLHLASTETVPLAPPAPDVAPRLREGPLHGQSVHGHVTAHEDRAALVLTAVRDA